MHNPNGVVCDPWLGSFQYPYEAEFAAFGLKKYSGWKQRRNLRKQLQAYRCLRWEISVLSQSHPLSALRSLAVAGSRLKKLADWHRGPCKETILSEFKRYDILRRQIQEMSDVDLQ